MNCVTADGSLHQSLGKLSGLTEVRDLQGKLIGYFSPASCAAAGVYSQAAAHFDSDEKQRRKESAEAGQSTEEVLGYLKSLGK